MFGKNKNYTDEDKKSKIIDYVVNGFRMLHFFIS